MNRYIFFISTTILSIFLYACGSDSIEKQEKPLSEPEQLQKEVMEIHDAVMPKMSDLNRVKRKLKDLIESNSSFSNPEKEKINITIDEIISAENAMMDWMKAYKAPKATDPPEKVIDYLKDEKIRISTVNDQMLQTLKNGESLLAQLENQPAK